MGIPLRTGYEEASYIIYEKDRGSYYAKDGRTGDIVYGGPNNVGGVSGADAAAVIQAAINALSTGGIIHLGKGTYDLGATSLTISRPISIRGEGGQYIFGGGIVPTKLRFRGDSDYAIKIQPGGGLTVVYDAGLYDLEIEAYDAAVTSLNSIAGVNLQNAFGVTLERVSVRNFAGNGSSGIIVGAELINGDNYSSYNHIVNCRIRNCYKGIRLTASGAAYKSEVTHISRCAIYGLSDGSRNYRGISIEKADFTLIDRCIFAYLQTGIYVADVRNAIFLPMMESCDLGIQIETGITDCEITLPKFVVVTNAISDQGVTYATAHNYFANKKIVLPNNLSGAISAKDTTGVLRSLLYLNDTDYLILGDPSVAYIRSEGHFYPRQNVVQSLGTGLNKWLELYLGRLGSYLQSGVNVAVGGLATDLNITFTFTAEPDTSYGVLATPDWNTPVYVTTKAVTGCSLHFGNAAPGGGGVVDWFLYHI